MNSPTVTIRNGTGDQLIIASANGELTVLDQDYNTIQKIRTLNRMLFADYNSASDMIVVYGSSTKQVVGQYKKFGHWEKI